MTKQPGPDRLPELLAAAGVDLSKEAGRTAQRWLERELTEAAPADWQSRFSQAAQLALSVYWDFMAAFNAFYEEPEGRGAACVARALRGRLGQVDPHMSEAVLDRIRNRRLHLLDSFRRKYQPSLFARRTIDAAKIRGYLIRVAKLESLHVPADQVTWGVGRSINLAALAEPAAPAPEPESPDPRRLAEAMQAFWGRDNGFTAEQRLEGLTSLGLGFLTGVPAVEAGSRALLAAKLPRWEETTTRLRQRVSQWLGRLEEAQRQATMSATAAERERWAERVSHIEERLTRLRVRLARQPARLRPRPAEVQEMLSGQVGNVGNTRFRRIGREIALMEDRVHSGGQTLRRTWERRLPDELAQLTADVELHLKSAPLSPRAHGLSAVERGERVRAAAAWQTRAEELLARIRGHFRLYWSFPLATGLNEAALHWLADAEDLYEFGALRRKGVIAGLGRRHGWRVERLLRSND